MEGESLSFSDSEGQSMSEQFVCLLLAHQKRIYGYILTLVPNLSDADDIMQETAMIMCRKFGDFTPGTSFIAWGLKIARYRVIKFRGKRKASCVHFSEEVLDQIMQRTGTMIDQMDDRVRALQGCIGRLSRQDSQLIRMKYEQGLKINAIAERLGRPVLGLYKVMARIHNSLRECVNRTMTAWEIT